MIESGVEHDPFALVTDPAAYVPRPASEQALDELERAVLLQETPVALFGPPGIGKTLLLRVLARRLEGSFRAVHLPYPLLAPEDLCRWALMDLDEPVTEDPEADLVAAAGRGDENDLGILLVIDDADALPLATARRLFELARASGGDLRVVLAAADHARAWRVFESSEEELEVVRFSTPMSAEETAGYLRARLADSDEPIRARFDDAALEAVHEQAHGIPGLTHLAATAVLRGSPLPTPRAAIHALADLEAEAGAPELEPVALPADPTLQTEQAPVEAAETVTQPELFPAEAAEPTMPPEPAPAEVSETPPVVVPPVAAEPTPQPEPAPTEVAEMPTSEPAPVEAAEPTPVVATPVAAEPEAELEIAHEIAAAAHDDADAPGAGRAFDVGQTATLRRRSRRRTVTRRDAVARRGRRIWLAAALVLGIAAGIAVPLATDWNFASGWPFGRDATSPPVDVAAAPPARTARPEKPVVRQQPEIPVARAPVTKPAAPKASPTPAAVPRTAAVPPTRIAPELPAVEPDAVAGTPPVDSPPPTTPQPKIPRPTENLVKPSMPDAEAGVAVAAKPRRAPKPPPPIVRVDIEAPEGAIIEIDGKRLGPAPVQQYPVPEGRRRVRARLPDGSVMQRTVEIGPDRTRVVFY